MIIISELTEDYKSFRYCPSCGDILGPRGERERLIRHYNNDVEVVRVKRFHCNSCHQNHTELPNTAYPRRQYSRAVIEDILEGYVSSDDDLTIYGPSPQTIKRWLTTANHA